MKLTDLSPNWVGHGGEGITDRNGDLVAQRAGIGLSFACPCGCLSRVFVAFANPLDGGPADEDPEHTWTREGDNFETLTLAPSIQRIGGCGWHGFVRNGEIVTA